MISELYLQIIGCVSLTVFTIFTVCVAIWVVSLCYGDFIERRDIRRWKKRTREEFKQ